jgi:hypothetical protein
MDQRYFLLPPLRDQVIIDHTQHLSRDGDRQRYLEAEIQHQRWLLSAGGTADAPSSVGQHADLDGPVSRPQRRLADLLAWVQARLRLVHDA